MCVVFHGITGVALIIATIIKTTSGQDFRIKLYYVVFKVKVGFIE